MIEKENISSNSFSNGTELDRSLEHHSNRPNQITAQQFKDFLHELDFNGIQWPTWVHQVDIRSFDS
jgi:hypothetical protein